MLFSAMRLFLQPSRLRTEGRGTSRERRSPRGFTLLETLVVIFISGLVLGVSHITLGKLAPQFDLNNATRMAVMAINQAQVRAITRGNNTTIDFGYESNGFTISDAGGAVVAVRDLPASVTVSSGIITFTPLGTLQDVIGWVYLWNGSGGRWLSVLRSGGGRIMKWNEQGSSLVEVLVTVSLMAVAMAGLTSMDINTIRADTRSTRINVATALAHAKLEELHTLRRSDADWADGSHGPQTGLSGDGSSGSGLFSREWVVERNYNNFNNLSRVTVTVSWDNDSVSLASVYW